MIAPKPRLLLTGASGFLGYNIIQQAQPFYQVVGVASKHTFHLPGLQMVQLDITDHTALRNMVRTTQPDVIMHTAANSDVNKCEQLPEETEQINVATAIYLAKLAAELGVAFVFTSTDMVFDGQKGNYSELDSVNPLNHYGGQKVRAEEGIRQVYPQAAICRMPLMYGVGGPGSRNFFLPLLNTLRSNSEIGLFVDEYRSALGAISAAKGLLLAASSFQGTYHMGGPEKASRYTLGQIIAAEAGISEPNIKPINQADIPMPALRPKDATLNSEKATKQGFKPFGTREEIKLIMKGL